MAEDTKRNNSKKRTAVFEALCGSKEHPDAETLYRMLKPRFPDISLGTIYRSLATFKEDGTAVCVANVNGTEHYDACVLPHPHLVCRDCGGVFDLQFDDELFHFSPGSSDLSGCLLEECAVSFSGLCPACANR